MKLFLATLFGGLAAAQAAGPAKAAVLETAESLLQLLLKGGVVMIPLGLCSIVALAVACERLISLRRKKVAPADFLDGLKTALRLGPRPLENGLAYCDKRPGPLSEVLRAGVAKLSQGLPAVEKAMEEAGAAVAARLKRSLRPLAAVAQLSTLLGLLGTVYGMISAFQAAAARGVGRGDRLAAGIYEALVTTAAGLTIAIPALLLHQILSGRIDAHVDRMEAQAEAFVDYALERARARARAPAPGLGV